MWIVNDTIIIIINFKLKNKVIRQKGRIWKVKNIQKKKKKLIWEENVNSWEKWDNN